MSDSDYSEITPLLLHQEARETRARDDKSPRVPGRTWLGPDGLLARATALLLMSVVGFGAFFCFDNPGALQDELKAALNISTSEFAGLYSWYSWPNVFLPVIGGFLIDSVFGVRLGTAIFAAFICAGQLLLSAGTFQQRFWFMKLARFVFGVGGESLNMAVNTYTVAWFRDTDLNMVFGLQLSVSRLGSTVNFLVMERLYRGLASSLNTAPALGWALLAASALTLVSLLCSLLLAGLDSRRAAHLASNHPSTNPRSESAAEVTAVAAGISLRDIRHFPASFWLLCLATLTYYGSIFPFVSLAQSFFRTEFSFEEEAANFLVGLVYLVSAVASPALGWLLDRTGRQVTWLCLALLVSAASHAVLAWTRVSPYLAIVAMGLAYSVLASALWSLPAILLPPHQLATAFGIMQALQNLGTGLITLGAGHIVDTCGYTSLEIFFLGWLLVSLLSGLAIYAVDRAGGGELNLSPAEAACRQLAEVGGGEKPSRNNESFSRGL